MRLESTEPPDRYLRVDQLRIDLKERAVRSGASVVVTQIGAALVALATVAVLARLLEPSDFGLVAMALPVVMIALGLRNFGLDLGAIHREHIDRSLANSLFWSSLGLNLVMTLLLGALGPVLAWFYGEPRLVGITLAFAAGILLLILGAQHETLLKRQMRFGLLSSINLIAAAAGALSAIALALSGAGYWALIAQTFVMFFVRSLLVWMMCDWRPQWPRPPFGANAALPSLRSYGRDLTATRLLMLVSNYCDRVAVGWLAGPALLGFYENGRRLAFLPLESLYSPLLDVAVAGFSRTAGDDARYRASAIKALQLVLALMLPCLAFSLVEMRPATLFFLGDRWAPAIPLARLLVVAAFAHSVTRPLMWFYLSKGQTARQVRWFSAQAAVTLAAVAAGAWLGGTYGVAVGVASANWGLAIPAIIYGLRESPFTPSDFARTAARPVLISLGAAAALSAIETASGWSLPPLLHCLAAATIYGVAYVGGWAALPGGAAAGMQMIRLLTTALSRSPDLRNGNMA